MAAVSKGIDSIETTPRTRPPKIVSYPNEKTPCTIAAAIQISSKVDLPPSEAQSRANGQGQPVKGPQLAVILLLGLDGAGKTTLLGTLQGEHDPKVRPSVGFKPTTMMLSDQLKVCAVQSGGTGGG